MPRLGSAAKECTETSTPGAHQEGAEQAQREGQDRQQQRPALEQAALVGDRERMDQRRAHQPRHERGVLHRIPEPEAAPAELVVRPPAAQRDAAGEERPGRGGPRAASSAPRSGRGGPRASPRRRRRRRPRSRRSRCRGSADGSASARVLQHRVQVVAVGRRRDQAQERVGGGEREQQEAEADHAQHAEHARREARRQARRAEPRPPRVHSASSRIHSSSEPSCAPHSAVTR